MSAAVICGVRVAAAHDGAAELVVTLRHDNGGRSDVTLDENAAAALLSACNATSPAELEGQSWQRVMEALSLGWNRLADQRPGQRTTLRSQHHNKDESNV